jgi:hypothetical protein
MFSGVMAFRNVRRIYPLFTSALALIVLLNLGAFL